MFENWSTKKKLGAGVVVFFIIIIAAGAILAPSEEAPSESGSPEEGEGTTTTAEFDVSNLQVSPSEAQPGDTIQISLDVANVGDNSGSHTIELNINQSEEKSREVSLDEGEDKTVTFQISRDAEGTYEVEAEGLTGIFTVQEISEANIEILSTYSYTDSLGYPTVVGEVKNTGDRNANYVKIVATFYDSSGDVVDSSFTYTELDILEPNQKSPFKVSLLEDTAFDSVDTQIQWDTTDEKPYDDYEILNHSGGIDSIGYYEVTGEVKNTGNREREYNKIVATFYDSTGKAVASEFTYTDLDTLSPGQKSPFSVSVLNEEISKLIDDYSLAVQS